MAKTKSAKTIKDTQKDLFRHAVKNPEDWKSFEKMMELFNREIKREWSDEEKVLYYSDGNDKTNMPGYSTMVGFACMTNGEFPPCFTSGNCYALYDIRTPIVAEYAVHNTVLIIKYPDFFEKSFEKMCKENDSIRIHVDGDFVNMNEVVIVNKCIERNDVIAISYTKKYDLLNRYVKENHMVDINKFKLQFSKWNGLEMKNPYSFPECHVYSTLEEYLASEDYGRCGTVEVVEGEYVFTKGNCKDCYIAHLKNNGKGGCFDMGIGKSFAMLAH